MNSNNISFLKIVSDLTHNKTAEFGDLSDVDLDEGMLSDSECDFLFAALAKNHSVKKISLSVGLTSSQVFSLLDVIQKNPDLKIEVLDLTGNGSDDKCIQSLVRLLSTKPITDLTLVDFDLNENQGIVLAEALATNNTLRFLDLGNNALKDNGACAIAKALEQNIAITNLNISNNLLTGKTILAFAHMLKSNMTLKSLNLTYVSDIICIDSAKELAIALSYNVTLTKLILKLPDDKLTEINKKEIQPQILINQDIEDCFNNPEFQYENHYDTRRIISKLLRSKNCPSPHCLEPLSLLLIAFAKVRKHIGNICLKDAVEFETKLPATLWDQLINPNLTLTRVGLFERADNYNPSNNNHNQQTEQQTTWQLSARMNPVE